MKKTDIIKTWNYLKRNGIRHASEAVMERLCVQYDADYHYENPSAAELARQRENLSWKENAPRISIVVPVYETPPEYLKALLDSVVSQTYPHWELILADAGSTDRVISALQEYQKALLDSVVSQTYPHWELILADAGSTDRVISALQEYQKEQGFGLVVKQEGDKEPFTEQKILYFRRKQNEGIAGNTNAAIQMAGGDYIGLLDHDDFLSPEALYRMAEELDRAAQEDTDPVLVYSDEDKYEENTGRYCSPNFKKDFNLDLILSNNYICHFVIMKRSMASGLGLRPAYDGAQDYDLVLRAVCAVLSETGGAASEELAKKFRHVPRILYHWRCHSNSTAENPGSKSYAYEAGRRALQDFLQCTGWNAEALHTRHLGFYRVVYEPDLFRVRKDIGACGGSVINRDRKIAAGMIDEHGQCEYENMPVFYAGPCNIASVPRDVWAVDARTIYLRDELKPLYQEYIGLPYPKNEKERNRSFSNLLDERIWKQRSIMLCGRIREEGYQLLWNPEFQIPV